MNALQIIQQKLKAPKSQYNQFGKYSFRNQEDILEAVKPLLTETNSVLTVSDDLVELGGSVFIKATAVLEADFDGVTVGKTWTVSAYAKHALEQKGMQDAQITGSASSYARKYALNGLFLIDDSKDSDTLNQGPEKKPEAKKTPPKKQESKQPTPPTIAPPEPPKELPELLPANAKQWGYVVSRLKDGVTIETIKKSFRISEENEKKLNDEKAK